MRIAPNIPVFLNRMSCNFFNNFLPDISLIFSVKNFEFVLNNFLNGKLFAHKY